MERISNGVKSKDANLEARIREFMDKLKTERGRYGGEASHVQRDEIRVERRCQGSHIFTAT